MTDSAVRAYGSGPHPLVERVRRRRSLRRRSLARRSGPRESPTSGLGEQGADFRRSTERHCVDWRTAHVRRTDRSENVGRAFELRSDISGYRRTAVVAAIFLGTDDLVRQIALRRRERPCDLTHAMAEAGSPDSIGLAALAGQ